MHFDDKVELQQGQPEDDGQDKDGSDDKEDDNLEPDVVQDDHHVEQETEGEEDVCEVEGEPGQEEEMVQYESSPGGQEVGDDQEDVEQDGEQQILLSLLEGHHSVQQLVAIAALEIIHTFLSCYFL